MFSSRYISETLFVPVCLVFLVLHYITWWLRNSNYVNDSPGIGTHTGNIQYWCSSGIAIARIFVGEKNYYSIGKHGSFKQWQCLWYLFQSKFENMSKSRNFSNTYEQIRTTSVSYHVMFTYDCTDFKVWSNYFSQYHASHRSIGDCWIQSYIPLIVHTRIYGYIQNKKIKTSWIL